MIKSENICSSVVLIFEEGKVSLSWEKIGSIRSSLGIIIMDSLKSLCRTF